MSQSNNNINIRIGGVPEHFNMPWFIAMERGIFQNKPYEVEWEEYGGGTGAMCKALREGTLDIAVALTEGIVADLVRGNPSKIVRLFVKTPLVWGIHTGAQSPYQHADELNGKIYAISRKLSGSHLMSCIYAENNAWNPQEQQFLEIGNLKGGIAALENGTADAFLWEKFMTQPFVQSGAVRRIGECITPWPCFVVAAREAVLEQHSNIVADIMDTISRICLDFMSDPQAIEQIAWRFQLSYTDAETWFNQTEWASSNRVSRKMLLNVLHSLRKVGVIDKSAAPQTLCSTLTELVG